MGENNDRFVGEHMQKNIVSRIVLGVILVFVTGWLLYMIHDNAVSETAWKMGVVYTIAWLVISAIILKYDQRFLRKLMIGFGLTFFYILLVNRLLSTNIDYIQPLIMFVVMSTQFMAKKWHEQKDKKQLVGFLLIWLIFVPGLFLTFDQRLTVIGQMKNDVKDYIRDSEDLDMKDVKAIDVVNISITDTYATVVFKTDQEHKYIFFDNGPGVDLVKREKEEKGMIK